MKPKRFTKDWWQDQVIKIIAWTIGGVTFICIGTGIDAWIHHFQGKPFFCE